MSYIRNAPKRSLEALRIQRQIAEAEVEKLEAQLAEVAEAENELTRLRRRRIDTERQLQETRNRVELAARRLAEPPIIWGGPDGLREAAKESARWDKRRRVLTGQTT